MWSFIKRLLAGPEPAEDPLKETVSFDDAGLTRSSELARAMGLRQFWPWDEIQEFGFRYGPRPCTPTPGMATTWKACGSSA